MVKVFTDRQFKDLLRPVHTLYLNCCIAFCRWTSSCQMIRFSFFLRCISLSSNCIALHCIALRYIELHWIGRTSDNSDGQLTKRRASVSADAKSKCPRSAPLGQMHSRSHFHTISREGTFERKHSASIGAAKSNCLLFWVSGLSLLRHQTFASKVFTHGWPFNKFSSTNNFYKTVICETQSKVPSTTILYDLNHVDVLDQTVCIGLPTRPQDSDFANLVVCLPRVVGTNMQLGGNSSVCNARQLWPWQLTSISQRITTVRSPILPGFQHQTPPSPLLPQTWSLSFYGWVSPIVDSVAPYQTIIAATIDETSSMISKYMISKYIYVINLCSVKKSKNHPCARLHWFPMLHVTQVVQPAWAW